MQRIVIHGRRRDLGLGSYPLVSLAAAREAAAENRRVARSGGDPTAVRVDGKPKRTPLVPEVFEAVVAARRVSWRTNATERKWRRLFETFVFPQIGHKSIDQVTLDDVREIVLPEWKGRGSTGYVLRQHLDTVMQWAIADHYRSDNPAAQVMVLAPKVKAIVKHHPSLHYRQASEAMCAVMATRNDEAVRLGLLFTVLTAARVGEVCGAPWSEIDEETAVWTRPAARMKAGVLHRVPLSVQAIEILNRIRALQRPGSLAFVVPKRRGGFRPISSHDFGKVLRPLGYKDDQGRRAVMHGFRSTFRVWAMEVEKAPTDACEIALAHRDTETARTYGRDHTDMLEYRRTLMQSWADHVAPRSGE